MHIEIQPGVRLFVDIEGLGLVPEGPVLREKPTLLLIHGGPGFDHTGFRPFFSRFTDLCQVVYFDQRGHGRSSARPLGECRLDTLADDLVRLCDGLGIVKPIVLGQSFGGFVAQRYLARHPAHPGKVVLSSTSHHFGLARKLQHFGRLGGPQAAAAAQAFWQGPDPDTWAAYEQHCRHLYNTRPKNPDAHAWMRFDREILFEHIRTELPGMDLRPGLAGVQCPVLVMAGEEDPVTPPEDAAEIVAALPPQWRAGFERFPGVGHGAWRDDPEAAERVLRAFLS
ncbi:MAG: alpha/beta hydrolase [Proteobacteria bacterium]|jgi:pimeloyl-ACP methyl ester carboxylesterase|nr:alpha/beta hydrolase [Methylibium sp.]MBY0367750.1 alpha/beta hydrolase [Burkholderiaceae bacterium]MCH8855809.1 alpha/beta hydrolase [Pseudomonadota bacterium]|mmetsp:Transcript_1245/g.3544  ORF Transcript_1245/g.3544 Transcript_1245/m.3544 type:complete len:282 (-) Transcript_1245:362-1207(-)